MKTFSTSVVFTCSSDKLSEAPPKATPPLDLSTTDARAWALAPQLLVSLIGRDFTVWVNPDTGSSCRLEASGDYEVSKLIRRIPKPVVLGQVAAPDALAMITNPHSDQTLRAVAHAIVAVEAAG